MRNIPINDVDHLPQAVLALGSDYPADTLLDTHSHRRAQFLYAPEGLRKLKLKMDNGSYYRTAVYGYPQANHIRYGYLKSVLIVCI